jgi:hypothetical protein
MPVLPPDAVPNSILIQHAKPFEPVTFYPGMQHPQMITIQNSDRNEDIVTAPASPEIQIAKESILKT